MSDADATPPGNRARPLTRDEALLWLNDRIGRPAAVYVDVVGPMSDYSVLAYEHGELKHWRADKPPGVWLGGLRDDIAGLYYVGDLAVDFTDLHGDAWLDAPFPPAAIESAIEAGLGKPGECLVVQLADDLTLRVMVYGDPDDES